MRFKFSDYIQIFGELGLPNQIRWTEKETGGSTTEPESEEAWPKAKVALSITKNSTSPLFQMDRK